MAESSSTDSAGKTGLPQLYTSPVHNQDASLHPADRRNDWFPFMETMKKLVVKTAGIPYQFGQMHRVGAGANCFCPKSVSVYMH
jgi:hypothetical protein